MADSKPTREGFLDRRIRVKWVLVFLALGVLAGLSAWVLQTVLGRARESLYRSAMMTQAHESAEAVARSIAVFGNTQIVSGNWSDLQEYADETVQNERLAYIAIVNPAGVAVVHTNRSFRGKVFSEPKNTDKVVHASVPAMSRTRQAATVRVGLYTGEVPGGGI